VFAGNGAFYSREVWIDGAVEQRKGGEPDHQEREQDLSLSVVKKPKASRPPRGLLPTRRAGCPCDP
jgi:hypothetical protein